MPSLMQPGKSNVTEIFTGANNSRLSRTRRRRDPYPRRAAGDISFQPTSKPSINTQLQLGEGARAHPPAAL
jgi:hypothetical protein